MSVRERLSPHPWTQLTEDHGVDVRSVDVAGEHDGASGDILLTNVDDAVLGMWVGDCAPVVLVGQRSVAGVHAGWRGLRDGVLDRAIEAMNDAGDDPCVAVVGAHIGPCCYEFGESDLTVMESRFGPTVRSIDSRGRAALDVGACIRAGFATLKPAMSVIECGLCTGCRGDLFHSHRVRRESERHVLAVWIESTIDGRT